MGKVKTKTHRQIPISFKLKAVHFYEKNGHNISKTAKTFGVDRKCVRNWVRNQEKLINQSNKTARFRVNYQNKCGMFPQMEEVLSNTIKERRLSGLYVDSYTVERQAMKIMDELYPRNTFKASKGWLNGFLNREKLVLRRVSGSNKELPADICMTINEFHASSATIVNEIKVASIFNMDETCVYLDTPWKHTYDGKSGKRKTQQKPKSERKYLSVAFTGSADGAKLKLLIIVPRKKPIENFIPPNNVIVMYEQSGNFDEDIITNEWLTNVFQPHCIENDIQEAHLFLDNAVIHKSPKFQNSLEKCCIATHYIPHRTTNLLQPATVSWMKALKGLYYQKWSNWYLTEESSYSKLGVARTPSYDNAIRWISEIWETLPSYIIFTSFQLCGITSTNQDSYHEILCHILKNGPINEYIDDYDDAIDGDLADSFRDEINEEEKEKEKDKDKNKNKAIRDDNSKGSQSSGYSSCN